MGSDGLPAWDNIPPPSNDELIQNAENERQRLLANARLANGVDAR
ncbi:tail fiber assembly protein [Enterobacter oligotrophicus]